MRIEGNVSSGAINSRKNVKDKKQAGQVFKPASASGAKAAAPNVPVVVSSGIEAMLALQGVDDVDEGKRRAIRHGRSMLDVLEEIKADLLVGKVGEGRLNKLMAQVTRARQMADPELGALIDNIDLLARVELAKLGRYTN